MLMNNGEFDEPTAAMANNNSFSLGLVGPRGFNPNQLMMLGGGQGTNAVAISHHNGNLLQQQANMQHGQRSTGQGSN